MKLFTLIILLVNIGIMSVNIKISLAQDEQVTDKKVESIKSDTTLVNNYIERAIKLGDEAQYDSSNFYFERAIEIIKKVTSHFDDAKLWEKFVQSYNLMGENYIEKGDYDQALEKIQVALDTGIERFGEKHPGVVDSYNNIGGVYSGKGEYEKAIKYFQNCLNIQIETLGEQHEDVARSYHNIGYAYFGQGEYEKAIKYYISSLTIVQNVLGENHPSIGILYNNLGGVYENKGDYEKAIEYYKKALIIYLETFGENHLSVARSYNNIGSVIYSKGDYDKALMYIQKSLNIRIKVVGDKHPEVANSFNNIAGINYRKGDYDKAISYYEKSLNIYFETLGENHPAVAGIYNNIGSIYRAKSNYEKAIEYLKKSLDIRVKVFGENHPSVGTTFNNMGGIYDSKGDYEKALKYFQAALSIRINVFKENHPEIANSYNNIGGIYFKKGDLNNALIFFQGALMANSIDFKDAYIYSNPSIKNIFSNQILLISLNNKAKSFYKLYKVKSKDKIDLETALSTYKLAVTLIDEIRGSFQTEGSKLFLAEQASKVYNEAIRTVLTLFDITSNKEYKEQALFLAEKSKSSVFREALSDAKAREFSGIPDRLLEQENTLRIDLAFYETQIQKLERKKDQKDTDLITEFEGHLFDLKREYETLIAQFEKEYPRYYDLKYQTKIASVSDIQNSLDAKTCILEYFIGDSSLYIFTISKDEYDVFALAIDSTFIPLLNNYHNAISKYDRRSFAENSYQLYQMLIKPIEDKIQGKEKLLIIPDGLLYSIPFEALISKEISTDDFSKLDYLIKHYDISYHYSANLWLRGVETVLSPKSTGFIAFAPVFSDKLKNSYIASRSTDQLDLTEIDVNYLRSNSISEEGNRKKFIPLPASEDEVKSIANLFEQKNSKADLYLHQEAKEEHLKTKARDYKYVHIATHGWMDEERPKLSGIAFSQPLDTVFQEDGILYSGEMYNLDLNADLVVLSACESGLGKLIKGEGPLSLTRGLLYSGANNIIISLWAVSDIHTGELMVELYKNILKGESYSKALRTAKLKMIENDQSAFPAKWSGFVLVGN